MARLQRENRGVFPRHLPASWRACPLRDADGVGDLPDLSWASLAALRGLNDLVRYGSFETCYTPYGQGTWEG
jgi:hypothetical protein